jgi:hypothetical protein
MNRGARRIALIAVLLSLTHVVPTLADGARADDAQRAQRREQATLVNHAYPRLDSQLNQLVAHASQGRQTAQLPLMHAGAPAVEVRLSSSTARSGIIAYLAQHGGSARVADDALVAYVPVDALAGLSELPGVETVRALPPPVAHVEAQGAEALGSPGWNTAGYTGAGVKVGVIDVGFVGLDAVMGTELPAEIGAHCFASIGLPSAALSDCETRQKHGTAVAEALLDVAPDVTLFIANPQSTFDLNETVDWMIAQGVTVINHSVGWGFEGPGDGTSRFSDSALAAVNTAVAAGITWINSAGNEGASTWTGAFTDIDADDVAEFDAGAESNNVSLLAGGTAIFQLRWDDNWGSAATNLDLFLYDADGNVAASSTDAQRDAPGQDPYEWFSFTAPASGVYALAVTQRSGDPPAWLELQAFTGETLQYHLSAQSIANPAESANPGLLAVGAAYWNTPTTIEPYSSQGPTRDGRIKPDVVASDGGASASWGAFYGTSQSAPLVAGLAALVKQRWGVYSPREIAGYIVEHATPVNDAPNDTWGYGQATAPAVGENPNPLPLITTLSPPQLAAGGVAMTLTIFGAGFAPGASVRWDGAALPTTVVSATQLDVQVTAQQLAQAATVELYVLNPEPGGGSSNVVELRVAPPGEITFASPYFESTWDRTDEPVASTDVSRTWMWGPGPVSAGIPEDYAEGEGGQRLVQYYDKSRMEITTDPTVEPDSVWYVTNGLLSKELITGALQRGDDSFVQLEPAEVNVAGDPDDASGPTYATFTELLGAAPAEDDAALTARVERDGTVVDDPSLAERGVTATYRVSVPGIEHQVASPFWDFMNSSGTVLQDGEHTIDLLFINPFYATGYPITEAYWASVKVGGDYHDVLMQCFERRCLTYTPDNPEGWQVEAGNVGRHYYEWRYGVAPPPAATAYP